MIALPHFPAEKRRTGRLLRIPAATRSPPSGDPPLSQQRQISLSSRGFATAVEIGVHEHPMVEVRLVLERFTLGGETPL